MFTADDSDLSESSRPEVGNGNIATVVGKAGAISNPHIFVAGVFNGCGQKGCHQVGSEDSHQDGIVWLIDKRMNLRQNFLAVGSMK